MAGPDSGSATSLSGRDALWVLRRCGRQGHVVGYLDDATVAAHLERAALDLDHDGTADTSALLRCLRCGAWARPDDPAVSHTVGASERRVAVADLPQPVRGSHGRKFALLRLLALERLAKGLVMLGTALVAYHVASDRTSLLNRLERLLLAAQPLGEQLGLHITSWPAVRWVEQTLGGDGQPLRLAGVLLLAYGALQLVDWVGLWGGWRWADYLAAVATALFVLEIYEIIESPTLLKLAALVINRLAVGYLVHKGRLFGVRGGHRAYVREVRDATEMADVLRGLGRSPDELTNPRII